MTVSLKSIDKHLTFDRNGLAYPQLYSRGADGSITRLKVSGRVAMDMEEIYYLLNYCPMATLGKGLASGTGYIIVPCLSWEPDSYQPTTMCIERMIKNAIELAKDTGEKTLDEIREELDLELDVERLNKERTDGGKMYFWSDTRLAWKLEDKSLLGRRTYWPVSDYHHYRLLEDGLINDDNEWVYGMDDLTQLDEILKEYDAQEEELNRTLKIVPVRNFDDFLALARKGWVWIEAIYDSSPKEKPENGFLLRLHSFDDWKDCIMKGYTAVRNKHVDCNREIF